MGSTPLIVLKNTLIMYSQTLTVLVVLAALTSAAKLNLRQEGDCTDTWPDHCQGRIANDISECYHDSIAKGCCKSCSEKNSGTPGCEYGNKAGWCTDYSASDCGSTPGVQENCCALCGGGGEGGEKFLRKISNKRQVPNPGPCACLCSPGSEEGEREITSEGGEKFLREITNKRQEGDCTDTWPDHCQGRIANDMSECYHGSIAKGCCKSCSEKNSGTPGCEYGNKAGWCTDYSASGCGSTPGVQEN